MHILGWSLGGALGYYLAIEHPDIVASLTVSGMSTCFGRPLLADGNCNPSVAKGLLNVLGALSLPSLLAGTAVQGHVASLPFLFAHQTTDEVMRFFWFQETAAFTRTPAVLFICPAIFILGWTAMLPCAWLAYNPTVRNPAYARGAGMDTMELRALPRSYSPRKRTSSDSCWGSRGQYRNDA